MLAIELEGVSATYAQPSDPARDGLAPPLREVSLGVSRGELWAVLGPNGSGKSTLIRVIAGLLKACAGSRRVLGDDVAELSRAELAKRIAVVPQRSEVALGFSVREVVAMGRAPHQRAMMRTNRVDREAVDRAIESCDLTTLTARPVASLSGGEQKRVHIARALAQQAPVLLLDEAGAHLDIRHRISLYRLIREEVRARDLACLATMHDLGAAAQNANRIALLDKGRLVAKGPVDEVMTAELLSATFATAIHAGTTEHGKRYFVAG